LIVGDAASTTFDSLTYIEHIRLLCCEFEIQTNSQDVIKGLSYITQRAEQDVPLVQRCTVTITWTGDEYRISGDGMEEDFELSVTSALETVCQRLHSQAIAALPDHIRIGAASGIHAEHAFLMIGPEGAGKTTLALSLMMGVSTSPGTRWYYCVTGRRSRFRGNSTPAKTASAAYRH